MLFKDIFTAKKQRRSFGYTPVYYTPEDESDIDGNRRFQFQNLRGGTSVSKKSVRGMIIMMFFVLFLAAFFWETLLRETRIYKIEEIQIESF